MNISRLRGDDMKKFNFRKNKFINRAMALCFSALIACAPALSGCGGGGDNSTEPEKKQTSIILNSFETQTELDTLQQNGVLGKTELFKSDGAKIKEGSASAKVTVISNPYKPGDPYLYQALNLEAKNLDYSDFSNVGYITLEVYNEQNVTSRIALCPVFPTSDGVDQWFELAPQSWTRITYGVERGYIPLSGEKRAVSGLKIKFERGETDKVYYLDDLRLHTVTQEVEKLVMKLDENEICSFDKLWQLQKLVHQDWTDSAIRPQLSIVNDFSADGRGGVLQVVAPKDSAVDASWPGFIIDKELVSLVRWGAYKDTDKLCFDVYTPEDGAITTIYFLMIGPELVGGTFFQKSVKLVPGAWTTVSFTVAELNAGAKEENSFENTGYLEITYVGDVFERIMYIDDIRMEVS